MADDIRKGLTEKTPITGDPKTYGMDNKNADQKPMPTPKQSVKEKGKSFTIR